MPSPTRDRTAAPGGRGGPFGWLPDGFAGPTAQLMRAVEEGAEPEIGGRDTLRTLTLVEACYRSASEGRAVAPEEVRQP